MAPFVLFVATSVLVAGLLVVRGTAPRDAWPHGLRIGLAAMLVMTSVTHVVWLRSDLVAMVPPLLPNPELIVTVTGALELLLACGLLVRGSAGVAALGSAALFVALFPANVYAATADLELQHAPTPLAQRTAIQLVFVTAAILVARRHGGLGALRDGLTATLPAVTGTAHPQERAALVLISRLELRSARDLPGFLRSSLRLRREFTRTTGALRLSLRTQPGRLTFWTWSSWASPGAMREFTTSALHRDVMRRSGPALRDSAFTTLQADEGEPRTWAQAQGLVAAGPGRTLVD